MNPVASMLAFSAASAAGADSTNVAEAAPRDTASSPSAPEPANRSSTSAPSRQPWLCSELKTASRTLLVVGRTSMPSGVLNRRPRASPAMIRSAIAIRGDGVLETSG